MKHNMVHLMYELTFICFLLSILVMSSMPMNANFGIETAKMMGNVTNSVSSQHSIGSSRSYYAPLRFMFTSPSYVANWWCVKMFEVTKSWDDNWLCSNRDIGLQWIWDSRAWRTDIKCVATAEPADKNWNDNF